MTRTMIIHGEQVEVTICKPSRRKAEATIQQQKRRRHLSGSPKAALWVAKERGLKLTAEVSR